METRASLRRGLERSPEIGFLRGHARLRGRVKGVFQVRVGEEDIAASQLVLNTGTRALRPPIRGLEKVPYLHAGNWLDQHEVPRRLVFIGAGYIALEMSQFYLRMGSRVLVNPPNGSGNPMTARITSIAPSIDPTARTGIVEAVIPNKDGRFLPGQYVAMGSS